MIKIGITTDQLLKLDLDAYIFFLEHDFDFAHLAALKKLYPPINEIIKQRGFSGKNGSSLLLSSIVNDKPVSIILVGLGDLQKQSLNIETYRRAIGIAVRIIETQKLTRVGATLPDPLLFSVSTKRLAEQTAIILYKAGYHFDKYITDPERKFNWQYDFTLCTTKEQREDAQAGIDLGISIGKGINQARTWTDMPPSDLNPEIFAEQAKELLKKNKIKVTIFDKKDIIKMGMGGIEGVSRGSYKEPRLVVAEYKSSYKNAQTIAIVGKGVTFDSGGLSLKPAKSMETMKDDMAGAAVVLSVINIISQFNPRVNVIAVAPLVENMPGGNALKPGDVLKFYNGKTAEVKNTDAEGRLILADALAYTIKTYEPSAIIDLATLTGACAAALGPFYAGLLTQHDNLASQIKIASAISGDRVWPLPMDNDYKIAIRNDIADMCNIGSAAYNAGAITAAFFLQNFVGETPWAHIDIAGTAFGVPDMSYLRPGATGFGTRLLVDLILNWQQI